MATEPDWAYTLRYKEYKAFQAQYSSYSQAFRLEFPPWPVEADPWESYEKKLDRAYEKAKQLYRDLNLENNYVIRDIVPAAVSKRNPAHFDWLIDYQIKGFTFAAIAKNYGSFSQSLSDRSVSEAIKSLAAILGFILRLPKRGRPKKAR